MPRNLDKQMKPIKTDKNNNLVAPDTLRIQVFGGNTNTKNATSKSLEVAAQTAQTVNMRFDGRYGTQTSSRPLAPSTIVEKGLPGKKRRSKKKGKFGGSRWNFRMGEREYNDKKFNKVMKQRNRLLVKMVWNTLSPKEMNDLLSIQSTIHNEWTDYKKEIIRRDKELIRSQLCKRILQALRNSRKWMEFEEIIPNENFQGRALEILEDWAKRGKVEKNTMGGVLSYRKLN